MDIWKSLFKTKKKKNSKFYILFNDTQNFIMGKILFWSLNFTKSLFLVPKLKKKILFSSLNFVKSFGINALLVPTFWPDFYFSPYILFLSLLVPKPINAWHLSSYNHPTNKKCWHGWRHSKIITKKSILTLKNCHVSIEIKKKINLLILIK